MEIKIPIKNSTQRATMISTKSQLRVLILIITIIITLQLQVIPSKAQQEYVNNFQLDCDNSYNATNGFVCNGNRSSCTAYVTFRSNPPRYATPPSIAFLLGSDASAIAQLNNISDVATIPEDRLVVVPVSCNCTRTGPNSTSRRNGPRYYQHNASYRLKDALETYFSVANNTYQGLTTCQALMNQNSYAERNLKIGEEFQVPIMCACPTAEQESKYGAKYLVSYLVTWGDSISQIADMFDANMQSVLDANELKADDVIYPFTPILVPLKSEPKINLPSSPPGAPSPQSNPTPPPTGGGGGSSSSKKWVFVGIGIGAGVLVLSGAWSLAWVFLIRPSKKPVSTAPSEVKGGKKDPESSEYTAIPGSYSSSQYTKSSSVDLDGFRVAIGSLTAYKFSELQKATGKFSEANRITGSVFRGEFNGDDAAIKILKGNVPTDEINLLKHVNHANIIRLSGYCVHEGNTYLVYEYAEKGSLDTWLFRQEKHKNLSEDDSLSLPVLGWKQRVQIACNIADALNYLHSYVNPPYIHKNLKSSNVLLDSSYRAKITNFGLARTIKDEDENGEVYMTKHVVGTHGYMAPEYIENGIVTPKLDVFAFGVVLLELLSGKPALIPSGLNHRRSDDLLFVEIRKVFEGEDVREKLTAFMDSNLAREYPLDLAYTMAQLACKCVDRAMNSRPNMSEVSMTLSKIYSSSMDWDPSDELANSSSLSYSW